MIGSKLDRAIKAYLIDNGILSVDDLLTANSSQELPLPCATVSSRRGTPDPLNAGNWIIEVTVRVEYPAQLTDGQTNIEAQRKQCDDLVNSIMDALSLSDDGQTLLATARAITDSGRSLAANETTSANNSDMNDFTCFDWFHVSFDRGTPNAEGSFWVEEMEFKATCCASNVD